MKLKTVLKSVKISKPKKKRARVPKPQVQLHVIVLSKIVFLVFRR